MNNIKIPDKQKEARAGLKDYIGYLSGEAGNMFNLTYVSSFLKVFYTDVLKIPTQKVANIFLFPRLWDAINDPVWGTIVTKRRAAKDGKYRPYLKWLAIPLALSELLCFYDISRCTQNTALILAFAYITYIMFGMLYTGINVPYGSLASVITANPEGRTMLSTFRTVGTGVGGAAPLLIAPLIIYSKVTDGNGNTYNVANSKGMFLFSLIMAIMSVVFYYVSYGCVKERVNSENHSSHDIKNTYKSMLKSKPFIILAITGIFISGQLQFSSLNQYLYKNYFCDTSLSIWGTVAQYLPMVVMIPLTSPLVRRFGKKELSTAGSLVAAAASIAVCIIKPSANNPALFLAAQFLIGFGYSIVSITNWAVVTDVIDYQYCMTGEHSESAVFSVYTFCRKLGQTIADYGGLSLLGKIGYNAETMANAGYVRGISENILTVCTVIPAVVYSLIFVLYAIYPLNKKRLEAVYENSLRSAE